MKKNKSYDEFMLDYNELHAACPKCGALAHSTTLVSYIVNMDEPGEYKDKNKCRCSNCDDIHIVHNRVRANSFKLKQLKEAFKNNKVSLEKLAYHSWCANKLGKLFKPTISQLDDLYTGFVSGSLVNLGSGKIPEYLDGLGPEIRYSNEGYTKLFYSLCELGTLEFTFEDWQLENPESEDWAIYIEDAIKLETIYNSNPEKWLIEFRLKISNLN